jgi:hypothetical protein
VLDLSYVQNEHHVGKLLNEVLLLNIKFYEPLKDGKGREFGKGKEESFGDSPRRIS